MMSADAIKLQKELETGFISETAKIDDEAKKLFEKAFEEKPIHKQIVAAGPQTFSRSIPGGSSTLTTYTQEPAIVSYYPSEEPEIRCQLAWQNVSLPIKKGEQVGELLLLADNTLIQKHSLFATSGVEMTWMYSLTHNFSFTTLLIIGAVLLFVFFGRRSRR